MTEDATLCTDIVSKLQLPNAVKRYGIGIAILSFLMLIVNKFAWDSEVLRQACRYGMLIGFLIASLSKEPIEDEFIIKLRLQSYMIAFVVAIAYAIVLPFLDYGLDLWFKSDLAEFKDLGDFEILWLLLSIQVILFELFRRANR